MIHRRREKIVKRANKIQFILTIYLTRELPISYNGENGERFMPLIALEGIDKSGKGTQAELLFERLKMAGYRVECIAFPDYETPLGREIKRFLRGRVKFCPEVRQFLYVANRWERKKDIDTWLREGKVVIADRYTPSGLAYGLANNLDLSWMMGLEGGLPVADMVIVIDVSVNTALKRSGGEKKDVYEKNRQFLEMVRKAYLDLAKKLGWAVIDGEGPIEEVAEQVWRGVSKLL